MRQVNAQQYHGRARILSAHISMTAASPAHFLQLNDPAFNYCAICYPFIHWKKRTKLSGGLILGLCLIKERRTLAAQGSCGLGGTCCTFRRPTTSRFCNPDCFEMKNVQYRNNVARDAYHMYNPTHIKKNNYKGGNRCRRCG